MVQSQLVADQYRVLARISKMPIQNSNFKKFACPDLATYLLQILIIATINRLVCQIGAISTSAMT